MVFDQTGSAGRATAEAASSAASASAAPGDDFAVEGAGDRDAFGRDPRVAQRADRGVDRVRGPEMTHWRR